MAKEGFKRGTTSKVIRVFIRDTSQTDGRGLTGLVFNSAGLVAAYCRQGDSSATALTLVTATPGTWTSSGFVAVPGFAGLYELGLPNAAVASGQTVQVILSGAANMAVTVAENQLEGPDNQDAVHYGLSALPNAAPGTIGGLDVPISEAGTMQAGSTSTTAVLRSGASATNKIYDGGTLQITGGTGVGQSRTIAYYNGTTKTATIAGTWAVTPDNTSVYAIRMANTPIIDATGDLLASVSNSTTVVLGSGASTVDSIYVGATLKIIAGTGAGQTRTITAYIGSNKTATVDHAYVPTPDATSVYRIGLVEGAALNSSLQPVAASVATPVSVTGISATTMQQLSAMAGSATVVGNVITFATPDNAHHWTQTFFPSIAAPTSVVVAQVD